MNILKALKALLGGIFSIFGILFGGLWDTVVGAFVSSEETQESTPAIASEPLAQSQPMAAPPVAPPPTPAPAPTPITSAPASTKGAAQASESYTPTSPDQMAAPRPRRRPGKTMTMFKEMARDLPMMR